MAEHKSPSFFSALALMVLFSAYPFITSAQTSPCNGTPAPSGKSGWVPNVSTKSACLLAGHSDSTMRAWGAEDGIVAFYNSSPGNCPFGDTACCSDGAEYVNLYSTKSGQSTAPTGTFMGPFGYQCTEFARRYFFGVYGIIVPPANAVNMCDTVPPQSVVHMAGTGYIPVHGDLMIFPANIPYAPIANGGCGFGDGGAGHVAVVDSVQGTNAMVVEQNVEGFTYPRKAPMSTNCARCFIHAKSAPSSGGGNSAGCVSEPLALATYQTGPAVALNDQCGLEVFIMGRTDGELYHAAQYYFKPRMAKQPPNGQNSSLFRRTKWALRQWVIR